MYGIIQRHGGTIEISSTKQCGTTFSILLPPASAAETIGPAPVESIDCALRILVVDDQEIICELIAEYLRADGHEVTGVANGREALERFSMGTFDLVITDQSMPE